MAVCSRTVSSFLKGAQPYSPCAGFTLVNAGASVGGAEMAVDLLGRPRLFGRRIDIGCYEGRLGGFTLIVR